ncbi:MAG: VTT domain-containing protein [Terriglobia bacterium]
MLEIGNLLKQYGYWIIFFGIFLDSIGLPLPAIPILIAAGAACALGTLSFSKVIVLAFLAMLLGDCLLFIAGRYSGWSILGFLCRFFDNPEACIMRSAESFYKHGRLTLLFSKFIPAVNSMAAPMAGSMNMHILEFLGWDVLASLLYLVSFFGLGFFFSHLLAEILAGFTSFTTGIQWILLFGLTLFLIHQLRNYHRSRRYRDVPRIHVDDLARKLNPQGGLHGVVVADTRSHGYYDPGAMRIPGSIRLEPNQLPQEMQLLPRDKEIYLYCT